MTSPTASIPLPEKIATLLHEVRWILLGAAGSFLALVLAGYHRTDPGFSHAVSTDRVLNPGGAFGAWLADLLYSLFGLSSWWWVALGLVFVRWGLLAAYGRADRRAHGLTLIGFVLVLSTSAALESMRFHSLAASLPLYPGGLLGHELAALLVRYVGFLGGTLIALCVFASGLSLMTGVSWLSAAERVGAGCEWLVRRVVAVCQVWQDRRAGQAVAERRETRVTEVRTRAAEVPAVRIEPAEPRVEKSERADKERQQPLFADLPPPPGSLPPLSLLDEPREDVPPPTAETLAFTSRLIERKLADFGVEVSVSAAYPGPVITRFEIEPAVGVKGSQIVNLVKDLARALSVASIRVVETIPGKSCMGLEIPNAKRQVVRLSEILSSTTYHELAGPLALALGKDIGGHPPVAHPARLPHPLAARTTPPAKKVAGHAIFPSLLYKADPARVRLILIDPKMLELSVYDRIPHLLAPVVTDMKQAAGALRWCVGEMERRYKLMSALGVRNLAGYNHKVEDAQKRGAPLGNPFAPIPASPDSHDTAEPLATLPHIVVVIDELADLMMVVGKKVEELIARLAQKARAAGVHLILATQRPSVDVITGLIKANIPTRIGFQVSSKIDSRTILDQSGAESLLGQGDMLYLAPGTGLPQRVHGAYVADAEVHRVVEYLKQTGSPNYVADMFSDESEQEEPGASDPGGADGEADPLYDQAVEVVLKTRRPSISLVQRHLRIGYNRAARLIESMERAGLVSAMNATGNREILVPPRAE